MPLAGVLGYLVVWLIRKRQQSFESRVESIELPIAPSTADTMQRQKPGGWVEMVPEKPTPVVDAPKSEYKSIAADDLKKIKGIGPKIALTLKSAGFVRFEQLADADLEDIEMILQTAGVRLTNMNTWKAQARLAADGEWDALRELQEDMRSGKRI
jgi:predicted flap endonuclease-1-like 5' DNA nuclease